MGSTPYTKSPGTIFGHPRPTSITRMITMQCNPPPSLSLSLFSPSLSLSLSPCTTSVFSSVRRRLRHRQSAIVCLAFRKSTFSRYACGRYMNTYSRASPSTTRQEHPNEIQNKTNARPGHNNILLCMRDLDTHSRTKEEDPVDRVYIDAYEISLASPTKTDSPTSM